MNLLMRTRGLWDSAAQYAVMSVLCWRDHDERGFAFPSKREVAGIISGLKPRRVHQVYLELEAMEAITRLGPDRSLGGRNRYVISIERAVAKKERGGMQPSASPGTFEPVQPSAPGGCSPLHGGDAAQCTGGMQPTAPPSRTDDLKDDPKTSHRATAAPRLPLFPLDVRPPHPEHRAIADARKLQLQKLRDRVAGVARSILCNPTLGQELLNGDIATSIDALVEATKRCCARKRPPIAYGDVVHGVCVSELFKFRNPGVVAGTQRRPRDLARRRR